MKTYRFAPDTFEQEGWQGQFARMERWHKRALHALDPQEGEQPETVVDFIYAFFQCAYHLRDWLLRSGAASAAELEDLMKSSADLRLCRDVCNGSKHFSLDPRRTKQTDHIGLMREYIPPVDIDRAGSSRPRLFVFESQDGSVEMVEIQKLMRRCLESWTRFCADLRPQSSDS